MTRRRFLVTSAGAAAAVTGGGLLSGCAGSVSGGSSGGGNKTLTIMIGTTELGLPAEIKAAEKALGFNINIVKYDITRLTAMITAGSPPDLVRGMGAVDTPYLAAHGIAQDLDDYFAKSSVIKVSDLDPVNDVWRYDGKKQGTGPRYGMVKDYSQDSMIWYNTALFDQANESYPSDTIPLTYDELFEKGKRLTQSGKKTKVYGWSYAGNTQNFMSMFASLGGSLFTDDFSAVDYSSPEGIKILTWYLKLAKSGMTPTVVNPDPNGWDWPNFDANRIAVATDGYWFGGSVNSDKKIAAISRFAPAPQFGTKRTSSCYSATGLWMPKAGKNKELAWQAFEYFLGGVGAKTRAKNGTGIPGLKSLRPLLPQAEPFQKQAYAVQQRELPYFSVISFTPYAKWDALDAVVNQYLPAAINGTVSAGKLADQLNTGINKQLSNNKKLIK
ncbi:extracellular solute-binding protein [Actinacidiphila oryziradicis]|uniref:Extracellular solute-binding protein n=1 Tax=Actinacidiphila oryziradicis TaxID=2571141 RepID=A0A4U0SHY3_9ACTN|nr:extracellular solute-binding protein [Actinacidiphila oryziradicis]TKA08683.1 extracellular solute-binding protein [Actinacidiphila oryziradicis]